MEDLTKMLLENYYGFGDNKKDLKSLSSYKAYEKELIERKSVGNDPEINLNQETCLAIRPSSEHQIDESDDNSGIVNGLIRSWRAFSIDDNDLNDDALHLTSAEDEKNSDNYIQDNGKQGSPKLATPEREKGKEDISSVNEDTVADNASEVSITSTKKRCMKKAPYFLSNWCQPPESQSLNLSILSSTKSKKDPIITDKFCDMKDASLIEFPINLLEEISNIQMLYLENNCLNELPDQVFSCLKYLRWLDVRNNWLKSLPMTIKYHAHLETLLLQGNRIEKLPLELATVSNLSALQISGNPIIYPPNEIVVQGFSTIMSFLKSEWNAEYPDEPIPSSLAKVKPSTRLKPVKSSKTFGTRNIKKSQQRVSTREAVRQYKPSNRCRNSGTESIIEEKLRWISKVREMLIKQAAELQKIKDREVLNEWRLDKRSYIKSMAKAAARSQEVIPFTLNGNSNNQRESQRLKSMSKNVRISGDMDRKMIEIAESLNRYDDKKSWSTDLQLESVELEIRKIEKLYDEIQALKRQNDTASKKFTGSHISNTTKAHKSPPSIII